LAAALERNAEKRKPVFRPHPAANLWTRSRSLTHLLEAKRYRFRLKMLKSRSDESPGQAWQDNINLTKVNFRPIFAPKQARPRNRAQDPESWELLERIMRDHDGKDEQLKACKKRMAAT
jgi:hypothetical protein